MRNFVLALVVVVLVGAGLAGGYFWGARSAHEAMPASVAPAAESAAPAKSASSGSKILYYRNPMGLPDTSPVPKKDQMGMDYIPVYAGDEPEGPGVKISLDKVQKLGVRTEPAQRRTLSRAVRAVGTVDVNERGLHTVSPRFEGWIQKLYVNTTGQPVARGQPLMDVYSPDLVSAEQEYIVATRGVARLKEAGAEYQAGIQGLVEGSLQRLRNWDVSEQELARLRETGKALDHVTLRSPVDGVVMEKPAVQGMRFMPGEALYKIADLSSVWLVADVFEQDLGAVRPGQGATVRVNAYPDKVFKGRVAFLYPTITGETRTGKVRIEMPNPGQLLKPAMYASVEFETMRGGSKLTVPDSSVLDTGTRQLILVRRGEGLFEPREVKTGARGDGYVEVLQGVKEGEDVVVSANFLIDAESNLKAAVAGFSAPEQAKTDKVPAQAVVHSASGTVDEVDAKSGAVTVSHGPVASLNWKPMTMEFKVKNPETLKVLKPKARVRFEFSESTPGEWTIVSASPVTSNSGCGGESKKAESFGVCKE